MVVLYPQRGPQSFDILGVHPRLEILPQKYRQVSARRPKNIGKGCKFLTKRHQIWQKFLKVILTDDFSSVLTRSVLTRLLTQRYQTQRKNLTQKYQMGTPPPRIVPD